MIIDIFKRAAPFASLRQIYDHVSLAQQTQA